MALDKIEPNYYIKIALILVKIVENSSHFHKLFIIKSVNDFFFNKMNFLLQMIMAVITIEK